jgi:hypothetical protein
MQGQKIPRSAVVVRPTSKFALKQAIFVMLYGKKWFDKPRPQKKKRAKTYSVSFVNRRASLAKAVNIYSLETSVVSL